MVRVIVERSFNTPLPMPMTYEAWEEMHQEVDSCLHLRGVTWIRSLISQDGHRCICDFEAPYADAVREACRESGIAFERVWRAEIWSGRDADAAFLCQSPISAEVTYAPPMTQERWDVQSQLAKSCFIEHGIQPLVTLMAPDGRQSVCLFDASSLDVVRSAYRKLGISFKQVWRSQLIAPRLDAINH